MEEKYKMTVFHAGSEPKGCAPEPALKSANSAELPVVNTTYVMWRTAEGIPVVNAVEAKRLSDDLRNSLGELNILRECETHRKELVAQLQAACDLILNLRAELASTRLDAATEIEEHRAQLQAANEARDRAEKERDKLRMRDRVNAHIAKRLTDEYGIIITEGWAQAVINGDHDKPLPPSLMTRLAAVLNPPEGFDEWWPGSLKGWLPDWQLEELKQGFEKVWTAALSSKPLEEELERLKKAWKPFEAVYQINHPWHGSEHNERSLSRYIPGAWPTWGDFKCLRDVLSRLREVQSSGCSEKGGKK